MYLLLTITSFIGASLLFLIQPIMAKALLPMLGGAPLTWNGTMVFFQTALLGGYLYAHFLAKKINLNFKSLKLIILLHIAFLLVILCFFGSGITNFTTVSADINSPLAWLWKTLFEKVGILFIIIAATAPLTQTICAITMPNRNPYALYIASNIGSMAGLFAYPIILEPLFNLSTHEQIFKIGVAMLIIVWATAFLSIKIPVTTTTNNTEKPKTNYWQRICWLIWSAIPSGLLCAVTLYISTDVASFPLIWVLPLAIYLISFMFAFSQKTLGQNFYHIIHPPLVMAIILLIYTHLSWIFLMPLALSCFFVVSFCCHHKLFTNKPNKENLSEFYLWLSLGGVIGGWFATLIAPVIFSDITEYPLLLIASIIAMDKRENWKAELGKETFIMLCVAALLLVSYIIANPILTKFDIGKEEIEKLAILPIYFGLFYLYRFFKNRPLAYGIGLATVFFMMPIIVFSVSKSSMLFKDRNFFGISKVKYDNDSNTNIFTHGTTTHGMQSQKPEDKLQLTSYYAGTLEEIYNSLQQNLKTSPYAVLGLGAGTTACLGKDQRVDFFEIDKMVVKIAENPKLFTYLRDCPTTHRIILGDGRLEIAKQPKESYGLIVIDAFTSDAIPIHLITKEAIGIYINSLKQGGIIAVHISNRHLNLAPVMANLVADAGLFAYQKLYIQNENNKISGSNWIAIARNENDLKHLITKNKDWTLLEKDTNFPLWTDGYSSIWHLLIH